MFLELKSIFATWIQNFMNKIQNFINASMNGKNYLIFDRGSVKYQAILDWLIFKSRPIFEEIR